MPPDLRCVPPATAPTRTLQARTGRINSALGARRLLVGLIVLLVVPGALGVAALRYRAPAPAPPATVEPHAALPQVPDSVARAQLDRSARASRLARKLTRPALLAPSRTGSRPTVATLATLAVAPRSTPYTLTELRALVPAAFSDLPGADRTDTSGAGTSGGAGGAVLVNANIDVPVGATLILDDRTPDVRLASSPAGFATLISRGTVQVTGTDDTAVRISSWDPRNGAEDTDAADGRAFMLQIGGRMDIDHGRFDHLGFDVGTSSGVAWRGAAADTGSTERVKAQGRVTSSVFTHNHFGAYTYPAQGMAWENNTFADNEEYGFDPHDFSDDFLVRANTARGNGKHGFIFSRGCHRNVLRGNYAYDNAGHGFMIDDGRSAQTAAAESRIDASNDNIVTANLAYDNANSGVEIEGGTGNVVSDNTLSRNDIGVRIKNRAAATVTDNTIVDSHRYGINVLDSAGQVPVTGNRISGSWAAINLATAASAALGVNPTTDVTTPLVVASVVTYQTSWVDEVAKYIRWNPLLALWGLILGLPIIVGVFRILGSPLRHRHHTVHRP
jgi:parallel beta-helix repeat protein